MALECGALGESSGSTRGVGLYAPGELSPAAKAIWRELVPEIGRCRPLSRLDRDGLALLCVLTVELRLAVAADRVTLTLQRRWCSIAARYGVAGGPRPTAKTERARFLPELEARAPTAAAAGRTGAQIAAMFARVPPAEPPARTDRTEEPEPGVLG